MKSLHLQRPKHLFLKDHEHSFIFKVKTGFIKEECLENSSSSRIVKYQNLKWSRLYGSASKNQTFSAFNKVHKLIGTP